MPIVLIIEIFSVKKRESYKNDLNDNLFFLQGAAAIILDIYNNGAIAKDGRLKPGDQILECNGIAITKEMAHERVCLTIKQKTAKVRHHLFSLFLTMKGWRIVRKSYR